MVLDDVFARTARDETALRARRFSTIPAMALHVDAAELDALLAHPDVVEIVEDMPLEPLLDESVELIGGEMMVLLKPIRAGARQSQYLIPALIKAIRF